MLRFLERDFEGVGLVIRGVAVEKLNRWKNAKIESLQDALQAIFS